MGISRGVVWFGGEELVELERRRWIDLLVFVHFVGLYEKSFIECLLLLSIGDISSMGLIISSP